MRAVWSFWSKPYTQSKGRAWPSAMHHWLAWGLSLRLARRHYPETMLVTDQLGKELLVDRLGLSFTTVSTELDSICHADPGWWALGKLVAYSMQEQPFLHLDTDVFLWKPLPPAVASAPAFAQCPEEHSARDRESLPRQVETAFQDSMQPLPAEWEWSRSKSVDIHREANCGILGGSRTDFIRYYANLARDLVLSPAHAGAWAKFPNKDGLNMVVEQFLLSACLEFHRFHPDSPFRGIHIRYLFASTEEAMDPEASARAGFTHLWGDAKRDGTIARRLEQRSQEEDVHFYRHCLQLSQNISSMALA
jgi:hypothetical protein